jgi:hypothetical protein
MEDTERGVEGTGEHVDPVRPADRSSDDDAFEPIDPEVGDSSNRRIPSALTL